MLTNGDHRPVGVELHNEKGTTAVPIFYSFASRYQEAYKAEMEHFLNVCQGKWLVKYFVILNHIHYHRFKISCYLVNVFLRGPKRAPVVNSGIVKK